MTDKRAELIADIDEWVELMYAAAEQQAEKPWNWSPDLDAALRLLQSSRAQLAEDAKVIAKLTSPKIGNDWHLQRVQAAEAVLAQIEKDKP